MRSLRKPRTGLGDWARRSLHGVGREHSALLVSHMVTEDEAARPGAQVERILASNLVNDTY